MTTTARLFIAGAGAAGLCLALGLERPDWALIAATLVLWQGPTPVPGTVRAAHRFIGTVLGLGVFAGLILLSPGPVVLVLALIALMFLIDFFVASNYAVAVMFITPMALLISTGGHVDSLGRVVVERGLENLIGVLIAVAVLWGAFRHAHRRRMRWTRRRVVASARNLLSGLETRVVDDPTVLRLRCALYYELIGAARAGAAALATEPGWAAEQWQDHLAVERLGYDLGTAVAATNPGLPLPDIAAWDGRFARLAGC